MGNPENVEDHPKPLEQLLDSPDLAEALGSDRFKQFLDHIPVAVAVSELKHPERVVYANSAFKRLSSRTQASVIGQSWQILSGRRDGDSHGVPLGDAIVGGSDFIGAFIVETEDGASQTVDAWSNIIEDEDGAAVFRLVALISTQTQGEAERKELEQRIRERDTLLRELQHRVKNNLQMITALIRMEARQVSDQGEGERFDRLAGRVESLALLYRSLSEENQSGEIDLGIYLSQIASAVMTAHAVEGIRLDLKVDTWPVTVNVAMPTGLVVNELMANALKYAFVGRDGGQIKLHSLVDATGCKVIVADDGNGLPPGLKWPEPGKLSALMVRSLRENANAQLDVKSSPGAGTEIVVQFTRASATDN